MIKLIGTVLLLLMSSAGLITKQQLSAQSVVFQYGRSLSSSSLVNFYNAGFEFESKGPKSFEYFAIGYQHRISKRWKAGLHLERSNFLMRLSLKDLRLSDVQRARTPLTPYSTGIVTTALALQIDRVLNPGERFEVAFYGNTSLGKLRRSGAIREQIDRTTQFWNALQFTQRTTVFRLRVGTNMSFKGFTLSVDTEPFRTANLFKPILFVDDVVFAKYHAQFVRFGLSYGIRL